MNIMVQIKLLRIARKKNPVVKQFFKILQPYKIKILRNTVIIRKGIDDGHDSREQDNGHADEQRRSNQKDNSSLSFTLH